MTFIVDYSLVGIWKSGKEVVSVSLVKEGIFVGRRLLFAFFNLRNGNSKKKYILFFAHETYHDDILMTCMGKSKGLNSQGHSKSTFLTNKIRFDKEGPMKLRGL